jgi:hypothetical protein
VIGKTLGDVIDDLRGQITAALDLGRAAVDGYQADGLAGAGQAIGVPAAFLILTLVILASFTGGDS